MRNRILTIALALSMLAVAFAAVPTTAAVDYTGSVKTTDSAHNPKTVFIEGEPIYVDVELRYQGDLIADNIEVYMRNPSGTTEAWFPDVTNDPVVGWYNSSQSTPTEPMYANLAGWEPDVVVFDIEVRVNGVWGWQWYTSTQVTVMKERLTLDPALGTYYPGQPVEITLVTSNTQDFYLQVVNDTGVTKFNLTDKEAGDDHYWSYVWTIASDFEDGWYTMRVRDEVTHAVWESTSFWVQKYELLVYSDRYYVLPGETVHLTYMIRDVATKSAYYGPTIEYIAHYRNVSGNETNVSGTLPSGAGAYDYVVPTNVALWSDIDIHFWANESERSAEAWLWLYLSVLNADVWTDDSDYMPGEHVTVTVEAWAEDNWDSEAIQGAEVDVSVWRNGSAIPAYGAADLATGIDGRVTYTFTLITNAPTDVYIVNATVSKAGATVSTMTTFEVVDGGWLIVEFDRDYYASGETATMSFRAVLNNQEVSTSISYRVHTELGILTTGNSSGADVAVAIPATYFGWIWVYADANINGMPVSAYDEAYVNIAHLVLRPLNSDYRPGDTIVWNWEILTGLQTASLTYTITDDDGVVVGSGSPTFTTSGSIEYDVPLDAKKVSSEYTAKLRLTSETGGYVEATSTVDLVSAHELTIWVEKSKYASGEYKPGSSITIQYRINSYSTGQLPVYRLVFWFSYDPNSVTVLATEARGSIEYTLPDDIPSGWMWIEASAYDGVSGNWLSDDETMVALNSKLSAWDRSIGGMSAIDFTLLVLIIVMILLLIIVPFLKGRMGAPKAPKPEPAPPTPPPPST